MRQALPVVAFSVDRIEQIGGNAADWLVTEEQVDTWCTKPESCSMTHLLQRQADGTIVHISTALTGTTVFLVFLQETMKRRR